MKILCIVQETGHQLDWCWETTARAIAGASQHEITITGLNDFRKMPDTDLVWFRGMTPINGAIWDAIRAADIPYIFGFTTSGPQIPRYLGLCRDYIAGAAGIIAQNQESIDALESAGAARVSAIPTPVDCDRFHPPKKPRKIIKTAGMAANIGGFRRDSKGYAPAVDACNITGIEWRPALKHENRIPHDEMPAYYRSLDVYIQPSIAEGCSNSISEAMASGIPCIICRTGWHGEVCTDIRDDDTGTVLFVDQNAASVVAAIEWIKHNPGKLPRLRQNARKWAQQLTAEEIAKRHDAIFELAVKTSPRGVILATYASSSYLSCLLATIETWQNAGARKIIVSTDADADPDHVAALTSHGAEVLRMFDEPGGWLDNVGRKAHFMQELLYNCPIGQKIAFLDADCLVMSPLAPAFAMRRDIAPTRFSQICDMRDGYRGTAACGAFYCLAGPGMTAFIDVWIKLQDVYRRRGIGCKDGQIAYDQYAFTDALRLSYAPWNIDPADCDKWNLNRNNREGLPAAVQKIKPAVVHLKGGAWRDTELIQRIIDAYHACPVESPVSPPRPTINAEAHINAPVEQTHERRHRPPAFLRRTV